MKKGHTLVGKVFGRLTVTAEGERHITSSGVSVRTWLCSCDCGNKTTRLASNLRDGSKFLLSCGCSRREKTIARNFIHGMAAGHGGPEYDVWRAMRRRCNNSNGVDYKYYGARGIKVCERWNSFEMFLSDMGQRPSNKHSIDRINVNGNYEPGNCHWATAIEQRHNQRRYQQRSQGISI